jgi:hypothetical protein
MKKVLSLLFLLFALNSVCVAEIMEDYRIACKNTDGKNLCKAVLTSDKNAEAGGFKIFPDLRIYATVYYPLSETKMLAICVIKQTIVTHLLGYNCIATHLSSITHPQTQPGSLIKFTLKRSAFKLLDLCLSLVCRTILYCVITQYII